MYPTPFSIDPLISGVKVMRPDGAFRISPESVDAIRKAGQEATSWTDAFMKQEFSRMVVSESLASCAVCSLDLLIWDLEFFPAWVLRHTLFDALVNYLATQVDAAVSPTWQEQIDAANESINRAWYP